MADLRASVVVDLSGNLQRRARSFSGALTRFSGKGARSLRALNRASLAAGRGLDRIGNRFTALLTGAAGIGAARQVIALEERLTRLGIQAEVSAEKIDGLKRDIFAVAQEPGIRVDPGEIIAAIDAIVEKTGDLDFARQNLRNIALAISGTGGAGSAIGSLIAEFKKLGITDFNAILAQIDTLVRQGKAGAFTVANLATQGERLVSAYTATGRVGPKAVRELGAVIQVIRQGTGSSEQATTAFRALLRTLQKAEKVKLLQARGITIFDPENPKVMRSVVDLMKEIIRATGGQTILLSQVFDDEAMSAFNAAAAEFQRTGAFESLDKFMSIQGDGAQLIIDSARAADTAAGAVRNLVTAWKQFSDANLSGPIQSMADALNSMDPDRVQKIFNALKIGGLALGGFILAKKAGVFSALGRIGGAVIGRGSGRRAGGIAGAAGLAAGVGVVPVAVVNWPAGAFGGGGLAGGVGGKAGRSGSRLGRLGRLGRKLPVIGAALTGLFLADTLSDPSLSGLQKAGRSGSGLGALGGAVGGAALGTLILPGIGTAIGAIAGGLIGEIAGGEIGEAIARMFGLEARRDKDIGTVTVELHGLPAGSKVRLDANPQSNVNVDLDAGFMLGGG